MDIQAIEQILIDRLSPLRSTGIRVRGLPSLPSDLGLDTNTGILTIYLDKTNFESPGSLGLVVQSVLLQFVIELRLTNLREPNGAYPAIRYICNRLIGFAPPDCENIYLLSHEFMGEKDKLWIHQIRLIVPTRLFEIPDIDSYVLLKQITLEDGYGNVVINEDSPFYTPPIN